MSQCQNSHSDFHLALELAFSNSVSLTRLMPKAHLVSLKEMLCNAFSTSKDLCEATKTSRKEGHH